MIPAGRMVTKIEGPRALTHGAAAMTLPPKERVVIASALTGTRNAATNKSDTPQTVITDVWESFITTFQYSAPRVRAGCILR